MASAYFAGKRQRRADYALSAPPRPPRRARKRASGSATSICRMQAIETYVTSSNSRLAREIEELR